MTPLYMSHFLQIYFYSAASLLFISTDWGFNCLYSRLAVSTHTANIPSCASDSYVTLTEKKWEIKKQHPSLSPSSPGCLSVGWPAGQEEARSLLLRSTRIIDKLDQGFVFTQTCSWIEEHLHIPFLKWKCLECSDAYGFYF